MSQPDVVIVGGGPAGLCTAIAVRMTGASVVVLEAAIPPIDKACGEGLLPNTVDVLLKLGVRVDEQESISLEGIRFVHGEGRASGTFHGRTALGIRRTVLHQALVERAKELKVDLHWGVKGIWLDSQSVFAGDVRYQPGLIVGADGQQSFVRRAVGLERALRKTQRFGFRRHFRVRPWTNHVEVYWHNDFQIYITPISSNQVGVALLTRSSHRRLSETISFFPSLEKHLSADDIVSSERGGLSVTRTLQHVQVGRVALIGDASGSVDAITGEGIGLAARQALALATAFGSGHLEQYEAEHRRIQQRAALMERLLLLLDRYPMFQSPVIKTLGKWPVIFEKLLDLHTGEHSKEYLNTPDRHAYDVVHF